MSSNELERYRKDFSTNAERFGLRKEYLDVEFKVDGRVCRVIGIDINEPEMPIVYYDPVAEKHFWTSVSYFLNSLRRSKT